MKNFTTWVELLAALKTAGGTLHGVIIGPVLANDILTNGHCVNRKQSPSEIEGIARDLAHNSWNRAQIGVMSVLDEDGTYLDPRFGDGQHRLKGIVLAYERGTETSITVSISVVQTLLGQDTGLPRTLAGFLNLKGLQGDLIAPALTALYRLIAESSGSMSEYMAFAAREEYGALLSTSATQVAKWVAEAKEANHKPAIKGPELVKFRTLAVKTNSALGAEAKIDAFLHAVTMGNESGHNVSPLLEVLESETRPSKRKEADMLLSVIRQTVENRDLTELQIRRLLKKKKQVKKSQKIADLIAA